MRAFLLSMEKYNGPCIYLLRHPLTNKIVYVGQTVFARNRYYAQTSTDSSSTLIAQWKTQIIKLGMRPVFEIVETIDVAKDQLKSILDEREKHWIDLLRQEGIPLLNAHNNDQWVYQKLLSKKRNEKYTANEWNEFRTNAVLEAQQIQKNIVNKFI